MTNVIGLITPGLPVTICFPTTPLRGKVVTYLNPTVPRYDVVVTCHLSETNLHTRLLRDEFPNHFYHFSEAVPAYGPFFELSETNFSIISLISPRPYLRTDPSPRRNVNLSQS